MVRRKPPPPPEEDDAYRELLPNIPRPDPSTITTKLVQREIAGLRELLEAQIDNLQLSLTKLEGALGDKSKPNIVAYISGAGLLVTLLGAFWLAGVAPIKEQIITLTGVVQHQADQIEATRSQYPTQQQFMEFKAGIEGRADRMYLDKLPRAEFDAWKAERDKTIKAIQDHINRLESNERTHTGEKNDSK
jgi:hypothetical protein